MKRLSACLLCLCILFGCDGKKELSADGLLDKAFGCKLKISVLESEFEGEFIRQSEDCMSLVLSAPAELDGMCFGYENGNMTVSVYGVVFPIDTERSPSASVCLMLFDLFSGQGRSELFDDGNQLLLKNSAGRGETEVKFNSDSLIPLNLINRDCGVRILFSEYNDL